MISPGFDGYLNNEQVPSFLVLNLAHAVKAFRDGLAVLPIEREAYIEHYIDDVFSYLTDADNARDYSQYFQTEAVVRLGYRYEQAVVQQFSCLLAEFCAALHAELDRIQAWDDHGVLWFRFDRLLGNDIVLRRVVVSDVYYPREEADVGEFLRFGKEQR